MSNKHSMDAWANAIAQRIADEWHGGENNEDARRLLRSVLYRSLRLNPNGCRALIGTGIIEQDYFEPL